VIGRTSHELLWIHTESVKGTSSHQKNIPVTERNKKKPPKGNRIGVSDYREFFGKNNERIRTWVVREKRTQKRKLKNVAGSFTGKREHNKNEIKNVLA
jgi:hypothetical protein